MQCNKCKGKLEVARSCRRIRLRCTKCQTEYHIHEVADELDADTEEMLASYTVLIYD
ncbi:MAG: dual CXXC motif small (seleno)protein [Deltaproteobacteria bacterium]